MRVTRSQANRALAAVRGRRRRVRACWRRSVRPRTAFGASPLAIDLALRTIDELPGLRVDLVEAASARLAAGDRPSADAIADMAIRRATCDLLA